MAENYPCMAVTDFGDQPMDNFDIADGKLIASFTYAVGMLVEFDGQYADRKDLCAEYVYGSFGNKN